MPEDTNLIIGQLLEINKQLGELTAEVRQANATMAEHANTDAQFHQTVGERVAALETSVSRTKWIFGGAAAVIFAAFRVFEAWWGGHSR